MTNVVSSLAVNWRDEAALLRRRGQDALAAMAESYADELEEALREADLEALTLKEAAQESGYSADHLGRLVRQSKIPNVGQPHTPRIQRSDLPRKPRAKAAPDHVAGLAHRLLSPRTD